MPIPLPPVEEPPDPDTLPLLPTWFGEAIADASWTGIIPTPKPGDYQLPVGVGPPSYSVLRDNVDIVLYGVRMVPKTSLNVPCQFIQSRSTPILAPDGLAWRANGTITENTTQLTLSASQSCPVAAGDDLVVYAGVSLDDLAEAESVRSFTIDSVNGRVITLSRPFGSDVAVYASEAALRAAAPQDSESQNKIGPWGSITPNTTRGRGYGQDHGVLVFANGRRIRAAKVRGGEVLFDKDVDPPLTSWTFSDLYCIGTEFTDLSIVNPRGSGIHTVGSTGLKITRLTTTGTGKEARFGGQGPYNANAISAWASEDLTVTDLKVRGRKISGVLFELRNENTGLKSADIKLAETNPADTLLGGGLLFGTSSVGRVKVACDQPTNLSSLSAVPWTSLDVAGVLPGAIFLLDDWGEARYGRLRIDGISYGPAEVQTFYQSFPANATGSQVQTKVAMPGGLICSGTVTRSGAGAAAVQVNAPDTAVTFVNDVGSLPANRWQDRPAGWPGAAFTGPGGQREPVFTVFRAANSGACVVTLIVLIHPIVKGG